MNQCQGGKNHKGLSYGGVAIVTNTARYSCKKIDVGVIPHNLEVIWTLLRPKFHSSVKRIIACCFYSPPQIKKNSKLADYIVTTLHMLCTRYPESAIILGSDRNQMDISPILN